MKSSPETWSAREVGSTVVYFNVARNEWVATNSKPVCQDHAHPMPCPFHGATS